MDTILCTAVIPAFNAEKTIIKCLDSFMLSSNQHDFELLVIDDGSTDKTRIIAEEYLGKYSNCRVISKPNGGVSSARNLGIKESLGKYVYFCDSDDTIERPILDEMIDIAEKNDCDLVVAAYQTDCDYHHKGVEYFEKDRSLNREYIEDEIIPQFIIHNGPAAVWNKLYKKEIINQYKIKFDESRWLGEDLFFNIDFIDKASSVYAIDRTLYYYNMDGNQGRFEKYGIENEKEIIEIHKKVVGLNEKYHCFDNDSFGIKRENRRFICLFIGILELPNIPTKQKQIILDNKYVREAIGVLLHTRKNDIPGWTTLNRVCMFLLKFKLWKPVLFINYRIKIPLIPKNV